MSSSPPPPAAMYSIFNNTKGKGASKLGPHLDAFDRDVAPTLQEARYSREFIECQVAYKNVEKRFLGLDLNTSEASLQDDPKTNPRALIPEMERRKQMIVDSGKLEKSCQTYLKALRIYSSKLDEASTTKRRAISEKILSLFPGVQAELVRIDEKITHEITRLRAENHDLMSKQVAGQTVADLGAKLQEFADQLTQADASGKLGEHVKKVTDGFADIKSAMNFGAQFKDLKDYLSTLSDPEAANQISGFKESVEKMMASHETLHKQELAIAMFKEEKKAWVEMKTTLTSDKNNLQSTADHLRQEHDNDVKSTGDLRNENNILKNELHQAQLGRNMAEHTLTMRNNRIAELDRDSTTQATNLANEKKRADDLQKVLNAAEEKVRSETRRADGLQTSFDNETVKAGDATKRAYDLQIELDSEKYELETALEAIKSLETRLEEENGNVRSQTDLITGLRSELETARSELRTTNSALETADSKLQGVTAELTDLQDEKRVLEHTIKSLQDQAIADLTSHTQTADTLKKILRARIIKLNLAFEWHKGSLQSQEHSARTHAEEVTELKRQICIWEATMEHGRSLIAQKEAWGLERRDLKRQLRSAEQNSNNSKAAIDQIRKEREAWLKEKADFQAYKRSGSNFQNQLDILKTTHDGCKKVIENLQQTHSGCADTIQRLTNDHFGCARKIKDIQEAHSGCSATIKSLTNDYCNRENAITEREADILELKYDLSAYEADVLGLEKDHGGCGQEFKDLNSEIRDLKEELFAYEQRVADLVDTLSERDTEIQKLQEANSAYQLETEDLDEIIDDRDDKLAECKQTIKNLQECLSEYEVEIRELKDKHSGCGHKIEKLEADHFVCARNLGSLTEAHLRCKSTIRRLEEVHSGCHQTLMEARNAHFNCTSTIKELETHNKKLHKKHEGCARAIDDAGIQAVMGNFLSGKVARDTLKVLQPLYDNLVKEHRGCATKVSEVDHDAIVSENYTLRDKWEFLNDVHGHCADKVDAAVYNQLADAHALCAGKVDAAVYNQLADAHAVCSDNVSKADYEILLAEKNTLFQAHEHCANNVSREKYDIIVAAKDALARAHEHCAGKVSKADYDIVIAERGQVQQQLEDLVNQHALCATPTANSAMLPPPPPSARSPPRQIPATGQPLTATGGQSSTSPSPSMNITRRRSSTASSNSSRGFMLGGRQRGTGYTFLVSGDFVDGQRVTSDNVDSTVVATLDSLIESWTGKKTRWDSHSSTSHKICSLTRVLRKGPNVNPPAGENPNVACRLCLSTQRPCVLVGDDGPVVVPLPESQRGNAVPMERGYWVTERASNVVPESG
ncbi:uncharacterized protein RAG0_16545 [Rhynchosporium agropyri]|uniref:Huntingtin-interacting protein 1 clathrin-binding domain-containing protein n=1 Tax=Rhynchosporium agropyri TaxID=914238 RepID=A0A1E1LQU9_9HELO|nr:uncharacterized protein RAG0_16545 [Rhynchosporium agropyri]